MRLSLWFWLATLFFIAVVFRFAAQKPCCAVNPPAAVVTPAPQTAPARPPATVRAVKGPIKLLAREEFTGYGSTVKDAEASVLEQAQDWLNEHVDVGWKPSADYLRQKGLVHFGEPAEETLEHAGHVYVVKGQLEVNSTQAEEMRQVARGQRMVQRHLVFARILGGLVCLFVVAGGYLRLEEATRGYYTTLLRLAALTVLALVGVGLWLLP
jgi:hypothetical protein